MIVEVRYFTKTGNTKKLAEAIADEVGIHAKTFEEPILGEIDVLFLGSSVYAAGVDGDVKRFIATLDGKVKKVVAFSTAALLPSTYAQVRKLVEAQGVRVADEEFHCRGSFTFMHKGKPDSEDLKNVRAFARKAVSSEL
jgi:flavodoxin